MKGHGGALSVLLLGSVIRVMSEERSQHVQHSPTVLACAGRLFISKLTPRILPSSLLSLQVDAFYTSSMKENTRQPLA